MVEYTIFYKYLDEEKSCIIKANTWLNAVYQFYQSHGFKSEVFYVMHIAFDENITMDINTDIFGDGKYEIISRFDDGTLHSCIIKSKNLFHAIYEYYCAHGFRYEVIRVIRLRKVEKQWIV